MFVNIIVAYSNNKGIGNELSLPIPLLLLYATIIFTNINI